MKLCNKCSTFKPFEAFRKRSDDKYRSPCKECEKIRDKNRPKRLSYNAYKMRLYTNTLRGRTNRMFNGAKRRAKEKGIAFDITIEHVFTMLQRGKCDQTGISFVLSENAHHLAPSLDRKESHIGYTMENTQIVCCAYNLGKQHMSDEDFKKFILLAASNISECKT